MDRVIIYRLSKRTKSTPIELTSMYNKLNKYLINYYIQNKYKYVLPKYLQIIRLSSRKVFRSYNKTFDWYPINKNAVLIDQIVVKRKLYFS